MRQDWVTTSVNMRWVGVELGRWDGGPRAVSLNITDRTAMMWLWVRVGEDYDELFCPGGPVTLPTRSAIKQGEAWVTKGVGVSEWDVATATSKYEAYLWANHTAECIKGSAERRALTREWERQWPNHCRNCDGVGGFCSSYDPSPAGVSLSAGSITECDPCPKCTEIDLCARCMQPLNNPEETIGTGPCPSCGWNYDDSLPPIYECNCWELRNPYTTSGDV